MIDNKPKEFTDMYLIAALLSYGFKLLSSNRENKNKQYYYFDNSVQTVYVKSLDNAIEKVDADIEDVEVYFLSKQLMFLGSYPNILKDLKQDIISHKMARQ